MSNPVWEWERGPGHHQQPLLEFYAEQTACYMLYAIALRALKREDTRTFNRMLDLATAAAEHEVDE